jgi:hypothetical protein
MARYFFHIHNGPDVMSDDEGMELPDLAAARIQAHGTALELAKSAHPYNCPGTWMIQISDSQGNEWGRVAIPTSKGNLERDAGKERLSDGNGKFRGPSRVNKAMWEKHDRPPTRKD